MKTRSQFVPTNKNKRMLDSRDGMVVTLDGMRFFYAVDCIYAYRTIDKRLIDGRFLSPVRNIDSKV